MVPVTAPSNSYARFKFLLDSCCTYSAKAVRHEAAENRGPMIVHCLLLNVKLWCFTAVHVNVNTVIVLIAVRFVKEIWFAYLRQFFNFSPFKQTKYKYWFKGFYQTTVPAPNRSSDSFETKQSNSFLAKEPIQNHISDSTSCGSDYTALCLCDCCSWHCWFLVVLNRMLLSWSTFHFVLIVLHFLPGSVFT